MYYPSSENKGADQLCSYCEADLRLCFAYADCWFSHAVAHFRQQFRHFWMVIHTMATTNVKPIRLPNTIQTIASVSGYTERKILLYLKTAYNVVNYRKNIYLIQEKLYFESW